jgi:PmbA protein
VVLDPFVTAQFLGIISSTLNGEAVIKGRSLFKDRVGEQVADPLFTLVDDPTNPLAYTATELDGEGLAARRNVLIDGGVLQQFVHNSYSARRAGTTSTGNAVRGGFKGTPGVGCLALQVQPGTRAGRARRRHHRRRARAAGLGPAQRRQPDQRRLLDRRVRAPDLTNGQVGAPVREFTIASTLQRMLLDLIEVGGDVDWLPMRAAGVSLVIGDMTMSGA